MSVVPSDEKFWLKPVPPRHGGRELFAAPHIPDHRRLVYDRASLPNRAAARFDAVVVPSGRSGPNLTHAAGVAVRSGCPLVVLCSYGLTTQKAIEAVSRGVSRPHVFAVDMAAAESGFGALGLELWTDYHGIANIGRGDTSRKRNVALLLARLQGWERILFLDDDVIGVGAEELETAGRALGAHVPDGHVAAAGWTFESFADNSAVCHAARGSGLTQKVFIGGGGLALDVRQKLPFFPDVYNEDWLFMLPLMAIGQVARLGSLTQLPYDPFDAAGNRSYDQEFGDTLAESLFGLMHTWPERPSEWIRPWDWMMQHAVDAAWWDLALEARHEFLTRVLNGNPLSRTAVDSVLTARRRLESFQSEAFADWVRCWRQDLANWNETVAALVPGPRSTTVQQSLYQLGLDGVVERRGFARRPGQWRVRTGEKRLAPAFGWHS